MYDDLDACAMAHPEGGVGPGPEGVCPVGGPARSVLVMQGTRGADTYSPAWPEQRSTSNSLAEALMLA